ncbi:ParA family protein [Fimbriiglobus ruber]|uniref:Chromosome (Plasmid) partitioning protein ParA n=1 Tax=Fimbriiglobus ruber TaxID=1908690 RepID=A0A225DK16_9BACT|nr:ParA family protein [Fimbriiglobus ruber]OWK38938.1 Chromosome (plasmid) partitioning protein ParA [Fimbriiglobus ruber]OWK38972.1 Chromosome (plasmid) partitioning protein ParA [Fimbriiglobus ruber]
MAVRYAVTLHKGGVGKTTTSVNLSGVLAERGHRVLIIDCDSQGDLSSVFLDAHEQLPHTVADIFADTGMLTEDLIRPTAFPNIFVIPADRRLEQFEQTHNFKQEDLTRCLTDAIAEVEHRFDYVILDTATRPHLTGYAALVACDVAVIPLEAARFSFRSVQSIRSYVELENDARSLNPAMAIRYFLSKSKKNKVHDACREALTDILGPQALLRTEIPDSSAINTALHLRKPLVVHSKKSKPSEAYRTLINELQEVTRGQANHANPAAA